ncbi:hypothetical protein CDL12_04750 [Handroanthus impetiginosus]|uniref:Uncharacterized protein n=1 Tax=Handroanthus impetiginosus TaxID=429701 RepID=A0A2G9HYH5_9LAMI|nr:hypothetical protein CDL12_04750 [Handroanthus impetiginosus]
MPLSASAFLCTVPCIGGVDEWVIIGWGPFVNYIIIIIIIFYFILFYFFSWVGSEGNEAVEDNIGPKIKGTGIYLWLDSVFKYVIECYRTQL